VAYGPNTSRTNRLPHHFFEHLYEKLQESEALLAQIDADGMPAEDLTGTYGEAIELLRFYHTQLVRQRQSHLGMETL
jgi:hypothetical protein